MSLKGQIFPWPCLASLVLSISLPLPTQIINTHLSHIPSTENGYHMHMTTKSRKKLYSGYKQGPSHKALLLLLHSFPIEINQALGGLLLTRHNPGSELLFCTDMERWVASVGMSGQKWLESPGWFLPVLGKKAQ